MENHSKFLATQNAIQDCINKWEKILLELSEEKITRNKNKQSRNIKHILGHLIDSASNNHQRMVRLQYVEELIFPDYQQDNDLWIALQHYDNADWFNLIQLWKYYNLHIIQIINSIDNSTLNNFWINFENQPVTLKEMIEGYPEHLLLHMNEINELLKD